MTKVNEILLEQDDAKRSTRLTNRLISLLNSPRKTAQDFQEIEQIESLLQLSYEGELGTRRKHR